MGRPTSGCQSGSAICSDDTCSDMRMWVNGALGCSHAVAKCVMRLLVSLSLESETLFDIRQIPALLVIYGDFPFSHMCLRGLGENFRRFFCNVLIRTISVEIYVIIPLSKIVKINS